MEITNEKGRHFDIPADYTLDIEFINPILDDVGSQSAPGTLPFTPHNLALLDFPDRMDRTHKYRVKREIIVREGIWQKRATQIILKANEKDKIVSTFYFDEAIFYEKIKNLTLPDIDYGPVRTMPVADLFRICNDVMFCRKQEDFDLFPVVVGFDGKNATSFQDVKWLNQISIDADTANVGLTDRSAVPENIDGTSVTLPLGYGVTPFLKLTFVFRKIAAQLGYTLADNIFETDASLKHLLIVNNVIDAIVDGQLDYRKLLPAITVADFLIAIANKFGVRFICNEVNKQIDIVVIDDILRLVPDFDLTPFLLETPQIEWSENKQLKLSSGTSILCAKSESELYQEMIDKYGNAEHIIQRISRPGYIIVGKLYYISPENTYFINRKYVGADALRPGSFSTRLSPYFNYYSRTDLDTVEMKADDEQLPVFFGYKNMTKIVDGKEIRYRHDHIAPGISDTRSLKTFLTSSNNSTASFDSVGDENGGDMPLMFCYKIPALQLERVWKKALLPMGTTGRYDMNGNAWCNLSLNISGEGGLYDRFWKTYDNMICRSNQTVTCRLNMPLHILQNLKFHTPKLLFNQPVLIERIKCRIGNGKCEITEATFRTLRSYV